MTFMVSVRQSFLCSQKASCGLGDAALLGPVDVFLRWRLDVEPAGLHFHKMYSIGVERNDVDLKMSASPVSFQDHMPHAPEKVAGYVFSKYA